MIDCENINNLRPSITDVDLDAIVSNFNAIQRHVGNAKVMPVIKANAYGHGMVECAKVLEQAGAYTFCVACLEEGIVLRNAGIKIPILVLGPIAETQIEGFIKYGITITASSVFKLEKIDECAERLGKKAHIHLKIDTGMERIGVHYYSAEDLIIAAINCKNCLLDGMFSHFATSEHEDLSFAYLQLERFLNVAALFDKHGAQRPFLHIANSGGILQMKESHLDGVRPGILIYGLTPTEKIKGLLGLKRAFTLSSQVSFFKTVREGASISYDRTFFTQRDTRIVTIPIGYGDGYSRKLSNRGFVIIRGKRYPIVGKVCMDQMMVDIGPDGTAYCGDEVTLIGSQDGESITVEEIAAIVDTDPRDVLCSTSLRIPRRFHYEGHCFLEGIYPA